jgi:hypothetical protein
MVWVSEALSLVPPRLCRHPEWSLTLPRARGIGYCRQCLDCGRAGRAVLQRDALWLNKERRWVAPGDPIPTGRPEPFDEELYQAGRNADARVL